MAWGQGRGRGRFLNTKSLLLQLFDQNELFLEGRRKKTQTKPTAEVTPISPAADKHILRADSTPGPGLVLIHHSPHKKATRVLLVTVHPNTDCHLGILEHCTMLFQVKRGGPTERPSELAWPQPRAPVLLGHCFPHITWGKPLRNQ